VWVRKAASLPSWKDTNRMQIPDQIGVPDEGHSEFRLLKNPLPEPPRRSHVPMDFDLAVPDDDDFDLMTGEEDDFDI
jgi:hypothetical protein